jgi:hypothetical protein
MLTLCRFALRASVLALCGFTLRAGVLALCCRLALHLPMLRVSNCLHLSVLCIWHRLNACMLALCRFALNFPVFSIWHGLNFTVLCLRCCLHSSAGQLDRRLLLLLLLLLLGRHCGRKLHCQHLRHLWIGLQEVLQQRQHGRLLLLLRLV